MFIPSPRGHLGSCNRQLRRRVRRRTARGPWLSAGFIALALVGSAIPATAQCGGPPSSCRNCHEIRAEGPFVASEPWHADHALGDFCSDCHGGSPAVEGDGAHVGLVEPLGNNQTRCSPCHQDHPSIAARYLALSGSSKPPRPAVVNLPRSSPIPVPPAKHGQAGNIVLSALIAALALVAARSLSLRERSTDAARRGIASLLRRSEWSPYRAGGLLGIVVTVSMAVFGRRLSGSGAYQELAAPIGRALEPGSTYWNYVIRPGEHWNIAVLAGAVAGALVAAVLGGRFTLRTMPDSQWSSAFGNGLAKRWLLAFIGAALTAIAAGIAGGCTASLAVSGGAALAPGAFAFMAGMFMAGIPTAWIIYRKASS